MFHPEDLLDFIELPMFSRRWKALGLNDEEDLTALQLMIMAAPRKSPVLRGTKGLRKLRFAPTSWNTGKSGAARVLYVYFEQYGMVLLCLVYGKGEVDSISIPVREHLNRLIRDVERGLQERFDRS